MISIYNIGGVILQGSINRLGNAYIAAQVAARRLAELFLHADDERKSGRDSSCAV